MTALSAIVTTAGVQALANGTGLQASKILLGAGQYDVVNGDGLALPSALLRTALDDQRQSLNALSTTVSGQTVTVQAQLAAGGPDYLVGEIGIELSDGTLFALNSVAGASFFQAGAVDITLNIATTIQGISAATLEVTVIDTLTMLPRFTTANRPAATQGRVMYDTDLNQPLFGDGAAWRDATGTAV